MHQDRYRTTLQTWDRLAQAYQDRFMDLDLYDDTYDAFCQALKSNASVLEIGCGPGNITRYLLRKRPDLTIEAIDVAPSMVELARVNNPTARFRVMDAREIGKLDQKYDGILSGFCMPYLEMSDCERLIHDSAALLRPGGMFYASVIESDYARSHYQTDSSGENRSYVYYYDPAFLQKTLETANFEKIEKYRKSYPKTDGTDEIHLIVIARRK